jgi:hypothetical protein
MLDKRRLVNYIYSALVNRGMAEIGESQRAKSWVQSAGKGDFRSGKEEI